ncbi:hypothetical protein Tco_0589893 [Tanacetum coccineum]
MSFNRDIFASAIGLEYSKDYVSLLDHETVKDSIATLGLSDEKEPEMSSEDLAHSSPLRCLGGNQGSHDQLNVNQQTIAFALCWDIDIDIAGILYNDLITKLTTEGKKGREKNITDATFKDSKVSEVPLTSYMRRVSKLPEKPLNLPSEDANIEATGDKSLSRTSVHPVSTPKAKIDKKRMKKKNPSSSELNISTDVAQTPTLQASESQASEAPEVPADISKQSLDSSKSAEDHDNQPIDIAGILYDDLISKLIVGGKKGREKNICYTRYLSLVMEHLLGEAYVNKDLHATKSYQITGATFKHSSESEVPLTSYMRQVTKLDEEPLITPSEEVNIEASGAMSLSGTPDHLVSKPKAKINKKRRTKKNPSSSEPNVSKDVAPTQNSQSSRSQHAEETKVTADITQNSEAQENIVIEDEHMPDDQHDNTEFVDSGIKSMGDVSLEYMNKAADEIPYDTKSEIQFVKRYKPVTDDKEPLFTSVFNKETDMEEDSDLESIPDDEVGSPSSFQTSETNEESLSEPLLSKSKEKDADKILDELNELNASADKPLDSLGPLQAQITSISDKVDQLESNITKKVSEIESSMPTLITETLKEKLPEVLSEALKNALPAMLDSIKVSVETSVDQKLPVFKEQVQQTFKAHIPKLFIQPMNKELIAFNNLEANRFVHLQKELSKVIQTDVGKKVNAKVQTGMNRLKNMVSLLKSAKVLKKTKLGGRRKENPEQSQGVDAQREQGNKNPDQTDVNVQGEQQSDDKPKDTNKNQENVAENDNTDGALVIHTSEENMSEEKTSDDEPPTKIPKVLIPTPTPLRSIHPDPTPRELTPPRYKKKKMTLEEAHEQLNYLKRLADQKAAEEKTIRSLEKINIQAHVQKLAEYKAKRAKTLAEFKWLKTQAGKISLSPPPELTAVGLTPAERKRKRTSKIVKEVFVTEDIRVSGMKRKLIPSQGVVGSPGLVITKPEAGIFYCNGNFDLFFQREDEFHLATTSQLIRQLRHIKWDTPEAEQMFKKMQFAIKARDDVEEARKIVRDNLDDGLIPAECKASEGSENQLIAKHQLVIKGLADGKASASNLKDIQVRDIVKEVEDYLKTYSSAEMYIR